MGRRKKAVQKIARTGGALCTHPPHPSVIKLRHAGMIRLRQHVTTTEESAGMARLTISGACSTAATSNKQKLYREFGALVRQLADIDAQLELAAL